MSQTAAYDVMVDYSLDTAEEVKQPDQAMLATHVSVPHTHPTHSNTPTTTTTTTTTPSIFLLLRKFFLPSLPCFSRLRLRVVTPLRPRP